MKKLTFLLLILLYVSAYSQPTFQTDITYENPGFDRAYSMCQTNDGGFVLAGGMSNPDGTSDAGIVKFEVNPDGEYSVVWDVRYGDASLNEIAYEVIETSDHFLIITGKTDTYNSSNSDAFVLKLTSTGNEVWYKTYGYADHDEGRSIVEVSDGYIFAGRKTNESGVSELFMRKVRESDGLETYNFDANYNGTGISPLKIEVYNSGYALCGGTKLSILESDGLVNWEYDLNLPSAEGAYDFDITNDGGFIVTGVDNGFPGNADYFLLKIKPDGTKDWLQYYGGETVDIGFSVKQTYDGGYLVSGSLWSFGNWGVDEIGLIKTDPYGDVEWLYIHEDDGIEWGFTLMLLDNGDFVISGSNATLSSQDADFYLVRFTLPYADFIANPDPACTGETVSLSPSYLVPGASYEWYLGEATDPFSTDVNAILPTSLYGTYSITLDVNGKTKTQDVSINEVIADFTASPLLTWVNNPVNFYDASHCNVNAWSWDLNGEEYSTEQNPIYSFDNEGPKDISLIAYYNSYQDTKTIPGYIKVFCNAGGETSKVWIESVQFLGTSNSTGNNGGYENLTSTSFNLGQGNQYNIVLTPGQTPGKPLRVDWRIWIDFNQDGIFQVTELAYSANNKKGEVSDVITVPDDAMPGTSLMRVAVFENFLSSYGPCSNGFSGEVEDYSFEINKASLPPVVDFEVSPTLVEVNDPVTFTDLSYNNPTSWTWTITESEGTVPTEYYYTASFDHIFDTEGFYTVTLEAENDIGIDSKTKIDYIEVQPESTSSGEYCIPEPMNCDGLIKIDYVIINGVLASDNSSSNCYDFYPGNIFVLDPGNTYDIELSPGWDRMRFFWRIWIDMDNDFLFEESELLYSGNNKKGTIRTSITIPGDVSYNEARMRISMKREGAPSGPCEIGFEGEVEDYPVFSSQPELGAMNIPELDNQSIAIYPNPVKGDQINLVLTSNGNNSIEIINKYGSVIDKFESGDSKITLNVSGYASGVYFVKLVHAGTIEVKKFIKR